jgi:hypothetical protein
MWRELQSLLRIEWKLSILFFEKTSKNICMQFQRFIHPWGLQTDFFQESQNSSRHQVERNCWTYKQSSHSLKGCQMERKWKRKSLLTPEWKGGASSPTKTLGLKQWAWIGDTPELLAVFQLIRKGSQHS